MTTKDIRVDSGALRVGAEVDLDFTDLLANGQAVGRIDGMVVFCFGPLPRERARVRIAGIKPKYAVANLVRLIVSSPQRAKPFCPVFGTCGGCQVQHLTYPAQLVWKHGIVRNALQRIGGFSDATVRPTVGTINPRAYRNKMSLVVDGGGRMSRLGFYRQRSHDVVPIAGCPIVMPQLNAQIGSLNALRTSLANADIFAQTRHIVARTARATGQSVVTFTSAQPVPALQSHAPSIMRKLPGAVGITNSFGLAGQNAIIGRKQNVLAGIPQIEEVIGEVRYRVSAGSFFQVNVEIVTRIFDFMRPGLMVPRNIVDLYCGAGTFSLFFAALGCAVVGVEESPAAVAEARDNLAINDVRGSARFVCARVEDAVRGADVRDRLRDAQIVFLDPPRKGTDETTLCALAESGVPNVWYLACDPATLSRDLKFLAAKGYALGTVAPFDMFPQTGHIETLATMYRKTAAHQHIIAEAFKDAPVPEWPKDGGISPNATQEYPDFVIR